MTVKEHYDTHLADFYSWMTGDFKTNQQEFEDFLKDNTIQPSTTKKAIDLGAAHGIQSVSLAKLGFNVTAIDFNQQLLDELEVNGKGLNIEIINNDIRLIKKITNTEAELIVCCGDTLSHLNNKKETENLLIDISSMLKNGSKMLLSFRDYSTELTDDNRFIPVKSDDTRILTCILEYNNETVTVTDLLFEKTKAGWRQKVSSYNKVRIVTKEIVNILEAHRMKILLNQVMNRMATIIAIKE